MKGFLFTTFLEMVENVYSPEMVEDIIEDSHLPNEGAYTDIGNYDPPELVRLMMSLSARTKTSISDLQVTYGKSIFTRLKTSYVTFMATSKGLFDFLQKLNEFFHTEVFKLYFDENTPRFAYHDVTPSCITLEYQSDSPLEKVIEGLILGAAESYGEKIDLQSKKLGPSEDKANNVLFTITKKEK